MDRNTSAGSPRGKFFLPSKAAIFAAIFIVATIFGSSGCNFFGKQEDASTAKPVGQLGDGKYIVGTWGMSSSSVSEAYTPNDPITDTYIFDPNGNFRIEVRLALTGGMVCSGWGVYRVVGDQDVMIYLQTGNCGFKSQFHLTKVKVTGAMINFVDADTNYEYTYFADHAQAGAPVGVWNFNNAGAVPNPQTGAPELGFEYIFIDHLGYFRIQTTLNGEKGFFTGYYVVENGAITFYVFDPAKAPEVSFSMAFSQFVTDGSHLVLVETDPKTGATTNLTGTKL